MNSREKNDVTGAVGMNSWNQVFSHFYCVYVSGFGVKPLERTFFLSELIIMKIVVLQKQCQDSSDVNTNNENLKN